jgi:FtsP/CotA-like multicopper oxidase with cupredoxin domain
MISRRNFLKGSAIAGAAAAGVPGVASLLSKKEALPLAPVPQQLRIPSVITGGDLTLAPATFQVFPGTDTNLLLINSTFPAPTIKLKKGDTFSATVHNNLMETSLLHWHGIHAPAAMNGHPKWAVAPGQSYSVNFPIIQRACSSFYHAHPDMHTAKEVYMGIAGLFIVEDDEELALGLPSGEYDIPLLIQDKRFDANNQLVYAPTNMDLMSGWLGDKILVNGTPNAFLPVAPTLYRFRLVNGSNARFFQIALSDGKLFTVIGNDGGLLESPITKTSVMIGPAERLEIIVDFSSYAQGQTVNLKSLKFTFSDAPGSGTVPQGAEMNILQFQISKTGSSNASVPAKLSTIDTLNVTDAKRTRVFAFAAQHHINDQAFDINRIDGEVPLGDLEQWTFTSEGASTHPIHVHGVQFQVIDRGNGNLPDPTELGWKDTVRLDPLGTVNTLVRFNEYTGLFLIHCHKLEHADVGMMANFEVAPQDNVRDKYDDSTDLRIHPNPATDYAKITFEELSANETLSIVDVKGTTVFSEALRSGTTSSIVVTGSFASGAYTIRIGSKKARLHIVK